MTTTETKRKYLAAYRVAHGQRSEPGVCERCGVNPKVGMHLCALCHASSARRRVRPRGKSRPESQAVYRTTVWRQVRAAVVEQARKADMPCGICGRLIDWDASGQSRWGPAADHVVPMVAGGAPFDRSNIRVVHGSCNGRKSGRRVTPAVRTSREW